MSLRRRLAGDTLVYGLGAATLPFLGLISFPFVARSLTTSEYGVLELVTAAVYLAVLAGDLGFSTAMGRSFLNRPPDDVRGRGSAIATAVFFATAAGALLAGAGLALSGPISRTFLSGEGRLTVVLAAITIPITILANLTRETMRLRFRPWDYFTSSLLGSGIAVGLTIPAVTLGDLGVQGVLGAGVVGFAAAGLFGIAKTFTSLRAGSSRAMLREMLPYGLPLVPGLLSIWAMAYADRLILAQFAGTDDVGLYAVANRISQPVALVATAVTVAYYPFMFDVARDRPDDERLLRRDVAVAVLSVGLGISVLLAALGPELVHVLAPDYDGATSSIGPLAAGLSAYSLASILFGSFLLAHRTALITGLTVLAGVVNLLLCVGLIPVFGALGAALGTAGGYVTLAGVTLWLACRSEPSAHDPARLLIVFATGIGAICAAGLLAASVDGPTGVLSRLGCAVAFAAALFAFGVLRGSHVRALLTLVRGRR